MTRNTNILQELKEISPAVADIGTQNPYSLPAGYFNTLPEVILKKITTGEAEESDVLTAAGKNVPLTVPGGYFDTLSNSIIDKIKNNHEKKAQSELTELSPILSNISKNNVYTVPDGYFDSLSQQITGSIHSTAGSAKVVSLFTGKTWMRYAAAVVVAVMAIGAYFIIADTKPVYGEIVSKGLKIKTESQFEASIAQVNETDILNYLKLNGDLKDAEVIQSMVDETELPDEAEYMDDEFLESFMKELEQTNSKTN
jgi:hypothetical protein